MRPAATSPQGVELDDFIRAYEAAWACGEPVELKAFLPEPGHPLYGSVLREVVRVDLEYHWARGQPRPLEDYRSSFPELFCDRESLHAITFEEYRLRRQAGEPVTPAEYENRFGVDVTTWPSLHPDEVADDPAARTSATASPEDTDSRPGNSLLAAALAYQQWCRGESGPGGAAERPSWEGFDGSSEHAEVFDELHRLDPVVAERLAQAVSAMPRVGGDFLGFRLLAELGRGAFGRVYLARQGELADRLVVLKIVPHLFGESRTLAQLQHNHIVPIYSVHQADDFQAVCMPFLGTTTLADILKDLRSAAGVAGLGKVPAGPDRGRRHERAGYVGDFRRASPGSAAPSERPRPLEKPDLCRGDPLARRQAGRRAGPRARPRHRPQGLEARQHPADRRRPADVAGLQPLRRYQAASPAPRRRASGGRCRTWPPSSWRRSRTGQSRSETSGATSIASGSSSTSCLTGASSVRADWTARWRRCWRDLLRRTPPAAGGAAMEPGRLARDRIDRPSLPRARAVPALSDRPGAPRGPRAAVGDRPLKYAREPSLRERAA